MKNQIQFPTNNAGLFSNSSLVIFIAIFFSLAACKQDDGIIPDGQTGPSEKPGLVIAGPGIYEVPDDPAVLADFSLPDFSNMPTLYEVKGTPKGEVTWEQVPAPGTAGFEEGMVVSLQVSDEGGNTATKEVIISSELVFPAEVEGVRSLNFIQDHETEVPVNLYVVQYSANQEWASLALVITPSQPGSFDPMTLDPAQITLHLYDENLQKVNDLTYPDGIWEPSTQLISYINPCGAFFRFSQVGITGQPVFAALTGGTLENQRFSKDFDFANLTPVETVLPPSCGPSVPAQVTAPVEEPCNAPGAPASRLPTNGTTPRTAHIAGVVPNKRALPFAQWCKAVRQWGSN
ncbi:MAG: hypothetical protein IPM82_14690 [Saprospiraceae bacterium]|nr:hypothetical protein [Saprospiraceae bacterium]